MRDADERPSIAELQRVDLKCSCGGVFSRRNNPCRWCPRHGILPNEEKNRERMLDAIPALLEIAAAALALRDAHSALDAIERDMLHVGAVSFDQLVGGRATYDAKVKVNECGAALLAALAKVSP